MGVAIVVVSYAVPRVAGHAGEGETSRVLAAQPELVRQDLIASSEILEWRPEEHGGAVRRADDVYYPVVGRQVARSELRFGSVGDPSGASAETGDQLLEAQAQHICDLIVRDFRVSQTAVKGVAG